MRCEPLAIRVALVSSLALWLAAPPALAQDAQAGDGCFPKCRSGYLCHEGVCITSCNPPCPDDEKCTPEGECVPKVTAPPVTPPVTPPVAPEPPRAPQGVALGFTVGAAACATPNELGCRTADGDVGIYASIRGGYQLFPWLIVDADLSFLPIFLKDDPNAKVGLQSALGVGPRFFPLGRRHAVDLVLGLHFGYFVSYVKNEDDAPSIIDSSSVHAMQLTYEAGVEFNLRSTATLGLKLDVFEPFWITGCTKMSGSTTCDRLTDVDNDQLYFGAGLSGDFLL